MSKNLDKYLHKNMDKQAGLEHVNHKTKIVATVGPACDSYEQLLAIGESWRKCVQVKLLTW